ncbi:MAG: large-conductance mechanosensitive channel protein MscL [Clostridia bacterium]|nr:large-conductance mechanosensitive channel protein MscL [Clostridia bacterium]
MKKFFEEFKAFIAKGNVIDMAVAVVVGGAFGKIVTSLVNDIIMPLIGLISGGVNVAGLKWVFTEAVIDSATGEILTPEAALTYGVFIQTVIDFLLIAFSIFVFLKIILTAKEKFAKKEEPKEEAPAEEPKETTEDILAEIRDLLKAKNDEE